MNSTISQHTLPSADELYEQYLGLIKWHAEKLCNKSGIEWDDSVQMMSFAFVSAYRGFREGKKVKFNTFLTWCLRNAIIDELSKYYNSKKMESEINIDEMGEDEEEESKKILESPDIHDITDSFLYKELCLMLSPNALRVLKCYTEPDELFLAYLRSMSATKIYQKHISEFYGMSLDAVQLMRNEIRNTLKTLGALV